MTFDSILAYEDESKANKSIIVEDANNVSPGPSPVMSDREASKKPTVGVTDRVTKPLKRKDSKRSPLSPILEELVPKSLKGLSSTNIETSSVKEPTAIAEMPAKEMELD